jgi:hypothetical protein
MLAVLCLTALRLDFGAATVDASVTALGLGTPEQAKQRTEKISDVLARQVTIRESPDAMIPDCHGSQATPGRPNHRDVLF